MRILRISKCVVSFSLALFALLVGFNNIVDYESNFMFVRHVLSMDSVFPNSRLLYRAIFDPVFWHISYALIIFTEFVCGAFLLYGSFRMVRAIDSSVSFARAKVWIYIGFCFGLLLWFLGFIVIGGEWFLMWQSDKWNGVEAAFRFAVLILLGFIFVAQPEEVGNLNK